VSGLRYESASQSNSQDTDKAFSKAPDGEDDNYTS